MGTVSLVPPYLSMQQEIWPWWVPQVSGRILGYIYITETFYVHGRVHLIEGGGIEKVGRGKKRLQEEDFLDSGGIEGKYI
jgi:hypothetical protein